MTVAADIRSVGIVGAGTMGAGIAQIALEAGHDVRLCDQAPEAIGPAFERITGGLRRRAAKLGHTDGWVDGVLERLRFETTTDAAVAGADLVIEAAVEDLLEKQRLFRSIGAAAPRHAILATNTSALSVTAIASATDRSEQVLGLHFFNPAAVMRLVEVVTTASTDPAVASAATDLMTAWGKTPVRCADSPGFIVNRVNRPFTIEALRLLEAGEAGVIAIDDAMRGAGFPMGPFELMDLIGIDVNLAAARGVWDGLGRPERLRPSPIQERLVAAGHVGRKAGSGFYRYDATGRSQGIAVATAAGATTPDAIVDRIRDAIDAEARLAADEGVATPADIQLALELGAGHPPRTTPPVR